MGHSGFNFNDVPVTRYGGAILLTLVTLCSVCSAEGLFATGKEYVYTYGATLSSGALLPTRASASWGLCGKLVIQAEEDSVIMQLQSLKMFTTNGPIDEEGESADITDEAKELLKPFRVTYKQGRIENIMVEVESVWATNIKRSIAGVLQLDLDNLKATGAFNSIEVNHYGQCTIEYVVTVEADNEKLVRKSVDPRTCIGHSDRTWSNVPRMLCPNNDQNPILKSSERLYNLKSDNHGEVISFINATGGIYIQPFQSLSEAQFLFSRQIFELVSTSDVKDRTSTNELHAVPLQHELPEIDLTQGRGIPEKSTVYKAIGSLLDELSRRLENPGLDIEVDGLHNTTIPELFYYLNMLDRDDLQTAFNTISGTSYKEETVRNMFLEALPQIGSKDAALFILDLIQQKRVSDITAVQLLTHLPFHVRKPDVQLLVSLQVMLNLPKTISSEVQNTAILSYGTLIYKTCILHCPYEMLDDYVRFYLDKFTESTDYEKKMVWLEGLSNIQLGKVVEFLEPIASGDNTASRHLRFLAAWASLPSAPFRPEVIYPVYWPILTNRTEHLEMRIAALTLLIVSNPSSSRIISLYWYMQAEPDQHLYNFFYTTLKSMERTNFPCYAHIGNVAAQFTRMLRKPPSNQRPITGNYLLDYQDTRRHFGAMLQAIIIAEPLTNLPVTTYITLNNHGAGINFNQMALYIKADGVLQSLLDGPMEPTALLDFLKQFKVKQKPDKTFHVEIIAQLQGKAILCLHLNRTNIGRSLEYLNYFIVNPRHIYQNMEFHVNQQRINVPLTMESVQVTDFGTNARLALTATSLFSIRGNFTSTPVGRNNHVVLRTSIYGTQSIGSYNPLIDLWYGAEHSQVIHGYLPTNLTAGVENNTIFFSYITPAEFLTTGITAHVRTTTNIRGSRTKSKLKSICPTCSTTYTVKKNLQNGVKDSTLLDFTAPELGGRLKVKLFDCDNEVSYDELVNNVLTSHRSNYQVWPALRSIMLGLHFIDYMTYVPPKGSCGVAVHVEPHDFQTTEVKLELARNENKSVITLTRYPLGSSAILQQWSFDVYYETSSWIADKLKIEASRTVAEEVLKICLDADRNIPWDWDFLATTPSEPASVKLNISWGHSDSSEGKCSGSRVALDLIGEISSKQIEESKADKWPYRECRQQSEGKHFTPYTEACYEASKKMSTLRKYQAHVQYENLPVTLSKWTRKLRAIYDLMGGDSSDAMTSNEFVINALFPEGSGCGELGLNQDKISVKYDSRITENLLTRTRIHKYIDSPSLQMFFSTCVLTPSFGRSAYNVSVTLTRNKETLVLGHCHSGNPGFALSAMSDSLGVTITLYAGGDELKLTSQGSGGAVYNHSTLLPLERNSEFQDVNLKKIRVGEKTVELVYANILLYVHWTKEQVLLFYPNFVRGITCGLCENQNAGAQDNYERMFEPVLGSGTFGKDSSSSRSSKVPYTLRSENYSSLHLSTLRNARLYPKTAYTSLSFKNDCPSHCKWVAHI